MKINSQNVLLNKTMNNQYFANNDKKENELKNNFIKDPKTLEQELNTINKEEDPKAYEEKLKELAQSIIFYNNEKIDITSEIDENDSGANKFEKLKYQAENGIKNNSIYERTFANFDEPYEQEMLQDFLQNNKVLGSLGIESDGSGFNLHDEKMANLFANTQISTDDFKSEYLDRKDELEKLLGIENDELESEKDLKEKIEDQNAKAKKDLNEFWGTLLTHKIKDEKLQLALAKAYMMGKIDTKA